jgi:hypothetical protein
MSESYIGLAPSYGVFEKQVIAGTTATSYPLDFDVVQSTQLLVSLDGIIQEPDYAYSVGRSATGVMQITFSEALTVDTVSMQRQASPNANKIKGDSNLISVGDSVAGTGIPANTTVTAINTSTSPDTLTISNDATAAATSNLTFGSRIFVTYLGKQLLTPSANNANTYPKLETFTGASNQVNFDLATAPPSAGALMVFVDGVFQREGSSNAWTLSGARVTFTTAPTASANISVMHLATEQSSLPTVTDASVGIAKLNLSNNVTKDDSTQTGSGWSTPQVSDTTWTINAAGSGKTYTVDDILVFLNGICLVPTLDYTVSGTTLTLTGGVPPLASSLVIRYLHK